MPIYEYRCKGCNQVTEVLQRVSDPPLKRCESCAGRLEKLISRTSFQLKGDGWFAQGYGAKSKKKPTDSGSSSSSSSGASSASGGSKDSTPSDKSSSKASASA